MNKIYSLFLVFILCFSFTNCGDNDGPDVIPLRDYQVQYDSDIAKIEEYLKTHAITVINNPGFSDDQDVTYTEVTEGDPTSLWLDTTNPLLSRTVALHDITYKIYYIKLRQGGGALDNKPRPCDVDAILASYEGSYIFNSADTNELKTFEFESVPFPQNNLNLESVIKGWREIFPEFNSGDFVDNIGNPTTYSDFGAGIMFLPSGLGYYNQGAGSIPAYSPLIFNFKLYEVNRLDQDQDGVDSWLEDLDGDRHLKILPEGQVNLDNSDDDLAPDYLDLDDDNDNVLTKVEIENETTGEPFPFAMIPTCTSGGLPKHRDPVCQ